MSGRHVRVRHAPAVTRSTHGTDGFDPVPATGAAELYGGVLVQEQIGQGHLMPESFQLSTFAQSIRPVAIVDTLPTLPHNDYPLGSTVVYTVDSKLYRNEADVWTAAFDAGDLVGEITETQIADDSISTPKLQANSVVAAKIAAGEINAGHLAADSVTAGAIAAGAVAASEIAAGAITAEKLAVGALNQNLVRNGSFEEGADLQTGVYVTLPTVDQTRGWTVTGATTEVQFGLSANAKTGGRIGFFRSTDSIPSMYQGPIPAIAGRTYRLSGWHWKGVAGGGTNRLRVNSLDETGAVVAHGVITHDTTSNTPQYFVGTYTTPTDGSVTAFRVELLCTGTPGGTEIFVYEDIVLELVPDNLANDGATVVIDDTGITISDGALTIEDEFSSTVATAGGFTGGWGDFIRNGFYNGRFEAVVAPIAPGRTADLPYWTFERPVGIPVATGLSGGGIRITFNALNAQARLISDRAEVTGGVRYTFPMVLAFDLAAASTLTVALIAYWFDASGAAISTPAIGSHVAVSDAARTVYELAPITAPANAAFVKLRVDITETVVHHANNRVDIFSASLLPTPQEQLDGQDLYVEGLFANVMVSAPTGSFTNGDFNDVITDTMLVGSTSEFIGQADFDNVEVLGIIHLNSTISPALTATTNDWSPTGLSTASVIRIVPDANRILTGIASQQAGRLILLVNTSTFTVTLNHDVTSANNNRFYCPGAVAYVIPSRGSVFIWYDNLSARWRVVG